MFPLMDLEKPKESVVSLPHHFSSLGQHSDNQNVLPIESSKSSTPQTPAVQNRFKEKSKKGCLTCKVRKKKCDEVKPVCRDCLRFGKQCIWVDYKTMSKQEIQKLRLRVKQQESNKKMRKRRKKEVTSLEKEEQSELIPQIGPSREYIEALKAAYPPSAQPISQVQTDQTLESLPKADISLLDCTNTNYHKMNDEERQSGIVNPTEPLPEFIEPIPLLPFQHQVDLPPIFETKGNSPPPLDLDFYQDPDTNPFLTFFKDLAQYNNDKRSPRVTAIEDDKDNENLIVEVTNSDLKFPLGFNIPDFLEQMLTLSHTSPEFNDLASSFNAAFSSSPQPPLSILPGLDHSGNYLYNFYVDTLSRKVSIAPHTQKESNSFQKIFLPLAQKDKGVLYGILAWSGFCLGGLWRKEGAKYAELAVKHLMKGVDFSKSSKIEHDRRAILNKLATILILCAMEIFRGDIKYWSVYMDWGWKLLSDNGGILNFDNNKEEHWLISNFAYHDLMASSMSQRGSYFPIETYLHIFADPDGVSKGNLNPLLGVCKNLFKAIIDINSLSHESKLTLDSSHSQYSSISPSQSALYVALEESNSEMSENHRTSQLLSIIEQAKELDRIIDLSRPDSDDLVSLSESELELQLTMFEAFQLSCKLHLRQSIMRCNPSTLESQVLVNDLVKCIDILIGSPMQCTLMFPIFMAGIHMVTENDRIKMKMRIQKMMEMYGLWTAMRVRTLIEAVWEKNPDGDRMVEWQPILTELGWEINFA